MGRTAELAQLKVLLASSGRVAIAAATGMGGIGKTQLAWHYADNHREDYPGGIWWVRGESFVTEIFKYAARMRLAPAPDLAQESEQVQWFYGQWLQQFPVGERLLVVDDVQDYGKLKPLLPQDRLFRVLLTTRKRLGSPVQVLEVPKLPLEKALELLEKLGVVAERLQAEPEAAQGLCEWVDCLPLGVELIGRYLADRRGLKFSELLQRLEAQKLSARAFSNLPEEMNYENNLRAAFALSWEPLSQRARQLGGLLSIFAVAPIPLALLQGCLAEEDPEDLEDALQEELVRGSLLDELEPNVYLVHSLLHKFYGEKLATELADRAESLQRSFAETLTAEAKTIDQTVTQTDIARVTETLSHLEVVANSMTHLLKDEDKIVPLEGLARVANFQSRWQDTEQWHKKSIEIGETLTEYRHSAIASSMNNLALLYESMGRYSEAEPLHLQSLYIRETQLGADHPDSAQSLNNLGLLYESMGRYNDAELLHKRSLHIREIKLGVDHLDTAQSLNNLAALYASMERYSEAEQLHKRSLHIRENRLGNNHPGVAQSLNNLGLLYELMGNYIEAEIFYGRCLRIRETEQGKDHPDTAIILNNLALLYRVMGRYSEAELLFKISLNIFETKQGEYHPNTATSLNNLAELYYSMGNYSNVESFYLRAISISEIKQGAMHPDTATSLNNLAGLYYSMGRYSEAEPRYLRSLHIRETKLGADHSDTSSSLNSLAVLYESVGRYSEAEPLYLRTLEIFYNRFGEDHPKTQTVLGNFRYLLQQALTNGRTDELSSDRLTQQLLQELRNN